MITTKFFIPPPVKYWVERTQLIEKLQESLHPGCRLTLISAPAGFGKTSLVSTWINKMRIEDPDHFTAWLSIDEGDNDPVIFWTYVISALQTQQENIGKIAQNLLTASSPLELDEKLVTLINDLSIINQRIILVLDDFHLVRNPIIHQSLTFFLEHIPSQFHLIIVSRTDPPLPLALLRGRGQLVEFRLIDLRFSETDAEIYLNDRLGLSLPDDAVSALNQKIEGWIAGLQMAALSLRDAISSHQSGSQEDFVTSFSGSNRYIMDYLMEEVLIRQPENIQNFLIKTSILERLCGPLCDEILKPWDTNTLPNSQSILEYLENSNLFIIPLDEQRYWYRYHQLFIDLLRKRLLQNPPEKIFPLHYRAINWYERNGLITSAINHAFQVNDFKKAASLVARITEEMWGRGEHTTLLAWMNALPDEEKSKYPHLLTFQVSMLISAGKLKEAEGCIPIIERYLIELSEANPEQSSLVGQIHAMRTYIASFYKNYSDVFSYARTALAHLNRENDEGQRCGVSLVLSNACLTIGDLDGASQALKDSIAAGKKAKKNDMALTAMANLAIVYRLQGKYRLAAQICEEGLKMVQDYGLVHSTMAADLLLGGGEILFEQNCLEKAEKNIRNGLAIAEEQHYVWPSVWGHLALARCLLSKREDADADNEIQIAARFASTNDIPTYLAADLAVMQAKMMASQGRINQVEIFLHDNVSQINDQIQFPYLGEYLLLAHINLENGNIPSAKNLIEQIFQYAEEKNNILGMTSALIQNAILEKAQGNDRNSIRLFERALEYSRREEYVRLYVEEGEPVFSLMKDAERRNPKSRYIRRLMDAFKSLEKNNPARPKIQEIIESKKIDANKGLIEPLSKRELEILHLISEGYANKEIAAKLFLSLRTVKYYSTGLYNKLGVDGRMQAVNRARELGLL